jgi:hypothetical protein
MGKQEFHDRLLALIREYDDSYEEKFTEYSTDERQHAMYDIEIKVKRYFRLR